ncbi:AbrB/MazE/SpoVT family DNA-binding domain-containing protein [Bifidobacterium sp. SO1]|uniref:AbrB/MazE/SpoVT family DNA-binding domain-containing protein n=1 Tax=Bifidobacterium sp. SO1 TaxID=2809029 RepID=UPI001BDDA9A4|nr:AbrB/MazE/SpoVT family DNA-binding domain-containing protein [Bifidobacterium sp. SO1]MBT1162998.1 hypothetical protein [Bifidobacterium sp. SO1]
MNTTTLVKWGNGQGIRLSRETIEQAGLKIGDTLEVQAQNGKLTVTPAKKRYIGILDYEKMFENYHGPQPTEDGFAAPVGKELM